MAFEGSQIRILVCNKLSELSKLAHIAVNINSNTQIIRLKKADPPINQVLDPSTTHTDETTHVCMWSLLSRLVK